MVSFISYILRFKNDSTPIGDIARDIAMDTRLNRRFGYKRVESYIIDMGASIGAIIALEDAHEAYKQYKIKIGT